MTPAKPTTIDDYLASIEPATRVILQRLRKTIGRHLPGAEECISYAMPAFRVNGGVVAGFAAAKHGCSYYPFSGRTLATLASELSRYEQTKSALHFSREQPLPDHLVARLIDTRLAEIVRAAGARARPRRKPPARKSPQTSPGRRRQLGTGPRPVRSRVARSANHSP